MASYREQFEETLKSIIENKRDNASIPTKEKRDASIARLLVVQREGAKVSEDCNLKRKHAILTVGNEDRLIKNGNEGDFRFVIAFEEVHSAIMIAHSTVGHGGEKKPSPKPVKNGPT